MYTPHARHMRVSTRVQLDSGGRAGCANIIGLGLGLGFLGEQGSTRTAISGGTATYVRIWISIIITTYGLMRADTSIGRDSGLRRRRGHS